MCSSEWEQAFELNQAHDFGLIKEGKIGVFNYQEVFWKLNIETEVYHQEGYLGSCGKNIICPYEFTIVSVFENTEEDWENLVNIDTRQFIVWNSETNFKYFKYEYYRNPVFDEANPLYKLSNHPILFCFYS